MFGCQIARFSNGGLKTGQKMYVIWSKMSGFQLISHLKTGQKMSEMSNVPIAVIGYSDDCMCFLRGL